MTNFCLLYLGFSLTELENLFKAFDTDNNGLIDALELIVTIAMVSGKYF